VKYEEHVVSNELGAAPVRHKANVFARRAASTHFIGETCVELLGRLRTTAQGLSQQEAAGRVKADGPNDLGGKRLRSIFIEFAGRR
jgi:hypothetical protein